MKGIRRIFEELLNIFLPKCCVLCKTTLEVTNHRYLCITCWNKLEPVEGLFCQKCGKPLPDGGAHCYHCRQMKFHFEYIRAGGIYNGALKEVIHKFKYQGKDFLAGVLSEFLILHTQDKFDWQEIDYVVPIPLYKKNEYRRGYNQALLLGERVVGCFSKPLVFENLIRTRKTRSQMELSREERLVNLIDAFAVSKPTIFKNKNVLLIDDVCTTGSTIEECAKVLKKAGTRKVWGLVLAHGA